MLLGGAACAEEPAQNPSKVKISGALAIRASLLATEQTSQHAAQAAGRCGDLLGQERHDYRSQDRQCLLHQGAQVDTAGRRAAELGGQGGLVLSESVLHDLLPVVGVHRINVHPAVQEGGVMLRNGGRESIGAVGGRGIVLQPGK